MATLANDSVVYTLNNGVKIPAIGLGTWQASARGHASNATKVALQNGYRHIDTAAIYKNEEEVGQGLKDSGLKREDVFITTKLWNGDHKNAAKALDESLKKLGVDYVDLYLIHWPVSTDPATGKDYEDWDYVDTWKQLQKLYKETKKVRAIGVSNFTRTKIERLLADPEVDVVPAVNQVEAHPLLTQPELYDYLKEKNIVIEAYSPLGSTDAPLFKNKTIAAIAKKNGVEPGHVLISWAVQRKTVVLPKSVTDSRIISNLKTFTLPEEDFKALNQLSEKDGVHRWADPSWNDFST